MYNNKDKERIVYFDLCIKFNAETNRKQLLKKMHHS